MNIPEICITFIAGILGVAYPILLEVVSRLDEKYSSLVVVDLFKKEKEYTTFRIFLTSSLILVLLYIIFNLPFIPVWTTFGVIAPILVVLMVISTTTLIIIFLLFVKKVLIYYSTYQVLQYLNQKKETEDHSYFQATFDILHLSIKSKIL
ncbi:hypothetical protein [Pedobacter ghigonis]|uniref:hypothetical protein n=1 Tax=Pedobacter ghigonis TaxID=2730403 RepID=UPI00158E4EAF|nr:hypothetical protein [Pedobacter ghigonis]